MNSSWLTQMPATNLSALSATTIPHFATIDFGQTVQGSIGLPGEEDSYTFPANTGDIVLVQMSRTFGDLDPYIRLYRPDDVKVCEADDSYSAEIPNCALSISGTYTLLVGDYGGTDTGSYNIFLQRLNSPGNTSSTLFGETSSASIGSVAEMDTYTFSAYADAAILVRMSKVSGDLHPYIRLYRPDGVKVCEAYDSYSAEIPNCNLPISGTYAILGSDYGGTDTGNYDLYPQCLTPPCGPTYPTVDFSNAVYSVDEGAGTATITVTLDAPSALLVTVDYATSDGTAVAPGDYISASNSRFQAVHFPSTFHIGQRPGIQ